MPSFKLSKLVIIQGLNSDDEKTGTQLRRYINRLRIKNPNVPPVEMFKVKSAQEFLTAVHELTRNAELYNEHPALQIETHGLRDRKGLGFPDGSSLCWHEMAPSLAALNKATNFNLLVCMSACFGVHSLSFVHPHEPSPCYVLIGPSHEAYPKELLGGFKAFYEELLTTLDCSAAVEKLRSNKMIEGDFTSVTAAEWFFKLADGYLRNLCTKEVLQVRASKIVEQYEREGSTRDFGSVERLGHDFANSFLDRTYETFFMLNDIAENRIRFKESFDLARHHAIEFLQNQR
jgi:hypothetical protein